MQARDGRLRGGNHPEVIFVVVVHLPFEVGQVAAGPDSVTVDDERQVHFPVTVLVYVEIDHPRDEGALKLGRLPAEDKEPRS